MDSRQVVTIAKKTERLLIGGEIIKVNCTTGGGSWGFTVRRDGKEYNCWIDADPEGNGPGWLDIERGE